MSAPGVAVSARSLGWSIAQSLTHTHTPRTHSAHARAPAPTSLASLASTTNANSTPNTNTNTNTNTTLAHSLRHSLTHLHSFIQPAGGVGPPFPAEARRRKWSLRAMGGRGDPATHGQLGLEHGECVSAHASLSLCVCVCVHVCVCALFFVHVCASACLHASELTTSPACAAAATAGAAAAAVAAAACGGVALRGGVPRWSGAEDVSRRQSSLLLQWWCSECGMALCSEYRYSTRPRLSPRSTPTR